MRLTAIARERQHLPILLASDITRRLRLQTQCENIARARKPFANSDRQELAIRTRPRPSMNIKISAPDTHTHTPYAKDGAVTARIAFRFSRRRQGDHPVRRIEYAHRRP
ncbi:hypothetical protein CGGC5_v005540 [Colletotrichum fructicola Nara gc5]|uniref:Uncharacterized protein n=1 Tax=Colletotrichum fructicola (strain Nara gc5) TaxID=1213859 RepID=A0A7J6JB57_COLFN|nr:hypothetical protein CFRS1_v006756 [Colletotrichum fructicola]KAF4486550.1 hypothetical protein CGGC5_v005540 [Colletotrichum fructicola Nara gc5]KAF4894580.1 hypothetical protein CGCFRS4_v006506 [Colletotrichum fructicola]